MQTNICYNHTNTVVPFAYCFRFDQYQSMPVTKSVKCSLCLHLIEGNRLAECFCIGAEFDDLGCEPLEKRLSHSDWPMVHQGNCTGVKHHSTNQQLEMGEKMVPTQ